MEQATSIWEEVASKVGQKPGNDDVFEVKRSKRLQDEKGMKDVNAAERSR